LNYFDTRDLKSKFTFLKVLLWAIVVILATRLFLLQIVGGERYRTVSENNYLRYMVLRSARGILYDRKGEILCRNRVSFSLVLDMTRGGDLNQTVEAIRRELGMDITRGQVEIALKRSPIASLAVLARDVPLSWVERVESHQGELKMLRIEMELRREYPYGALASHAMGYVGLLSPEEMKQYDIENADLFQEVGKAGVEKTANTVLMGRNGLKCAQVNNLGREVEDPGLRLPGVGILREPVAGQAGRLNLDMTLQKLLEEAFGEETGAALFMDPATGAILCWVSMPGFDPNLFSGTVTRTEWQELVENPAHPLINRPIQGTYPAGSTFKPFVALVGLQEGLLDRETVFPCSGVWEFGNNPFHCWAKGGHGNVDLLTAIQNSCNIFFYRAGERIGIDRLARWAKLFGLGQPTGVDLPGERSGTLPSPAWKKSKKLGPWYAGETLSVSIGQGYLTVTPIQLLAFYGTLATGGVRMRPQILTRNSEVVSRTAISPESLEVVKEGLWRVVNGGGTGARCRVEGKDVCAKTGTAQVVKASAGKNTYSLEKAQRDHAWLAGFAPRDVPKVAFVVMVEHGGHGGDVAARIARVGLEYILNNRVQGIEPPPKSAEGEVFEDAQLQLRSWP
jgi:penicillin-binding protein 2